MAGMNVFNSNGVMGYSGQHTGGSTAPNSGHMTAHIWKWSHPSNSDVLSITEKREGNSCRKPWIGLPVRHFVMQVRRRKRRRRHAKKKVWENHYYLSFSSLPMLSFLFPSLLSPWPCFAHFHACLQNIFKRWPIQQGFGFSLVKNRHLSL